MNPIIIAAIISSVTSASNYNHSIKPIRLNRVPLWFICWLSFLLGIAIGLFLFN